MAPSVSLASAAKSRGCRRLAPPTVNLEDPDDNVTIDVVRGEPRKLPDGQIAALNNSFGFGGHNVALEVKSVEQ